MQLNRLYTDTSQKLPTNSESNIMRCSDVPRFKYLPIRLIPFVQMVINFAVLNPLAPHPSFNWSKLSSCLLSFLIDFFTPKY